MKLRYRVATSLFAGLIAYYVIKPSIRVFRVPHGFVGPLVVFFDHPKGGKSDWGPLRTTYHIPMNGVLLLKEALPRGWAYESWEYDDGSPIPDADEAQGTEVVIQQLGVSHTKYAQGKEASYITARMGVPGDPQTFGANPHFTVTQIVMDLGW